MENEKSGKRTGGSGGVPTIVGIISDVLETDIKERTKLKKRAVELKQTGLYQIPIHTVEYCLIYI